MVQKAVGTQQGGNTAQASALPFVGLFAMVALAAGVGASVYKMRRRDTRQVQTIDPSQHHLMFDTEDLEE